MLPSMRPFDPHRAQGFAHFHSFYRPRIRPEGHVADVRRAFQIDKSSHDAFHDLRPFLRHEQKTWPDTIARRLSEHGAISAAFLVSDLAELRRVYARHAAHFAAGDFSDAYFDSLEDLALLYLFHDVRSVWLAGVYAELEEASVDKFFEYAKLNRHASPRRIMRAFSKAMTLELSQISRVFIAYERAVADLSAQPA